MNEHESLRRFADNVNAASRLAVAALRRFASEVNAATAHLRPMTEDAKAQHSMRRNWPPRGHRLWGEREVAARLRRYDR